MDEVMKKFGVNNIFRVMVLVCDWLNRDEHIQVNGLVGLIDCTNMTMKHHLNLMNMENAKKMMQFYQVLCCQQRVTVTSCFVNKVIRDLESIDHLCINPIHMI